jgi:uncharacterized Zn finger protein
MRIVTLKWSNGHYVPDKEIEVDGGRFEVEFGETGEERRVSVGEQDDVLWIDSDSDIAVVPGEGVIGIACIHR